MLGSVPPPYRSMSTTKSGRARELLTHVLGIKLQSVAIRLEFANEFYFSRWFRQKVGGLRICGERGRERNRVF